MRLRLSSSPVPNRKPIAVVFLSVLFFFNVLLGHASTVVYVITSNEIVVGSDAKKVSTIRDMTPVGTSTVATKAEFVAHNRILVATVGLNSQDGYGYEFSTWIRDIDHKLPEDISVKEFVTLLEKESVAEFNNFDSWALESGRLTPMPDEFCRPLVQYLVLGYEDSKPLVYLIEFEIEWDRKHVARPQTLLLHPSERHATNFDLNFIGEGAALGDFPNRDSYAHKQAVLLIPNTFARVLAGRDLKESEAVELIRALIHIEEEVVPSHVEGFGRFFRIPVHGAGSIIGERGAKADRKTLAGPKGGPKSQKEQQQPH